MFVTIWLGILEISTGVITAANAGHEYPAVMKNGKFSLLRDRHGLVIGGMLGTRYREYEIRMEPGDKLFVYTDGVPEGTAADGTMFTTDRMVEALNRNPEASVEEVLGNVQLALDDFVAGAEQFDDVTMLCIEYKGPSGG
jgi:serine phosphatase RsbU (regulator of sigma subunit)